MSGADAERVLRVGHVAPSLGVGGLEKMLVDFARHIDARRFQTVFFSVTEGGAVARELRQCGQTVIELKKPPGFRASTMLALSRLLRQHDIDIVHTHNDAALLYGAPAARIAGLNRIIHTRHGFEPRTATLSAMLRPATWLVRKVVCVSQDNARLAREQNTPEKKIRVILNGVDKDRFPYSGPRPDGPVVTIARLSPEKGVENLVRAVSLALPRLPSLRVEIAGDGPCMGSLRALADELGVTEAVRFLGETGDISALLSRASLFVLPSLTEGVSLTLLEAMSTGLPVVATRVGGNGEVVEEGATGLLVPCGSPDDLANAMVELLSDPDRLARLGRAGRERLEKRFDLRRTIDEYQRLYLE
jgi:glycosyltransferase involved in cell wall biosynthesis